MINKIKKKLGEAYHTKDLGATQSYLGIRITRDRAHRCTWIDQEAYINSVTISLHAYHIWTDPTFSYETLDVIMHSIQSLYMIDTKKLS